MASSINKRRKILVQESYSQFLRNWEDLDVNILKKIFNLIPICDLLTAVSSVCKSWQSSCWDALFWGHNKLDLSLAMACAGNIDSATRNSMKNEDLDEKLMKLLKSLMNGEDAYGLSLEHWRLSIKNIFISKDLNISDELLLYLARRTPGVENLTVSHSSRISREGFAEAMSSWKNVKHICIGRFSGVYFTEILEEIGRNCPELITLHINHPYLHLGADNSYAIVNNLPRLKTVKLEGACLFFKESLSIFWRNSFMLEALQFCDCCLMFDDLEFSDSTHSFRIIFERDSKEMRLEMGE